jgi:hypothetical protein
MERKKLLAATWFRNLYRPALSELLHRLRHPGTLENVPNLAIYFVVLGYEIKMSNKSA